jgi:ribosomal-protein-alanine acetyltransferase
VNNRPAIPGDIPAILAVERACDTAAHWSQAEYELVFDAGATPRSLLVAEDSAAIVGFIMVRTFGPEWEIENVAVLPEARGRGIATALVTAVLGQAEQAQADSLILEVRASNAAARGLYARTGFLEVGHRPAYYSHPTEDAVLYRLELSARLPSAP